MVLTLQDLPIELLHLALQYLPISDLLSFARTSRSNFQVSSRALTTLDLAIFPRRIHSLLSFFDATDDDLDEDDEDVYGEAPRSRFWARRSISDKALYQVGLTTSNTNRPYLSRFDTLPTINSPQSGSTSPLPAQSTPLSIRMTEITNQNTLATTILSNSSLANLRTLTLRLYDLNSERLASTLAAFTTLQTLNLDFSHPYIHDTTLPAKYWKDTPSTGTPIWNSLAGIGPANATNLRLHSLRALRLARSGITSFQLRNWIEANPQLRDLRLNLCRGVDSEFTAWLAAYSGSGRCRLEVLRLTDCALLELKSESDFAFVSTLAASGSLCEFSLRGCKAVSEELFLRLAKGDDADAMVTHPWSGIPKLVSPRGVVMRRRAVRQGGSSSLGGCGAYTLPVLSTAQLGSVSPALTISDGMLAGSGPSGSGTGCGNAGYFGTIEVDTDMDL